MKISVITPVFNSANVIKKNIFSIISQNYTNFEHIIVDNLSSDNTLQIAIDLYADAGLEKKLKIISGKDQGISDAFNKGITAASGEIISILNSDDYFVSEDVFETVVLLYQRNSKILIVHGDISFKDDKYGSNVRHPLALKPINGIMFNHPAMFAKKEVFLKAGLFDLEYKFAMDVELFTRLSKVYYPIAHYSFYANKTFTIMSSGGASWNNELDSIREVKKALIKNDLWHINTFGYYISRLSKAYIKILFTHIGLKSIVKIWRNLKWGN